MRAVARRTRRWAGPGILAMAVALVLVMAFSGSAWAQQTPGPSPSPGPSPTPTPSKTPTATTPPAAASNTDDGQSGKITDQILGSLPAVGIDTAPLGNYHVYYNDPSAKNFCDNNFVTGALCTVSPAVQAGADVAQTAQNLSPPTIIGQIEGWLTDTMFTASKWVADIGLNVLGWVFNSTVRDWVDGLIQPAVNVANTINVRLLGPLNLAGFFLFLVFLYTGWQTFHGRTGSGLGEFGLSLVIYGVAIVALTDPATGFKNAVDGITNISDQVIDASLTNGLTAKGFAGDGRCPQMHATDPRHSTLVRKAQANGTIKPDFGVVQCVLRVELVDVPYDLLNWGQVIKPNAPCWAQRVEILNKGLGAGNGQGVSDILKQGGSQCEKMFSKNPSMDRFFAALLFMLSVLVMMGLLIITAGMDLIALVMGIFLLMWAWPMFALGLLPGVGRKTFWRYITSFIVAAASVIVMSAFLAVLVWGCAMALDSTTGLPIAMRFLLMDIVGLMLLRLRSTMHHKVATAVRNTGDRMPGAKGTVGAAAAGGAIGGAAGGHGAPVPWGGTSARPHPNKDARSMSMWVHPANYQSPRMAAPHELAHQGEQKFWHSKGARPLVRAKHGVKTLYPVRHPIKTLTSPVRAVTHPIKTVKAPFKPLPKPKGSASDDYEGDGYPNNHHPWIPE